MNKWEVISNKKEPSGTIDNNVCAFHKCDVRGSCQTPKDANCDSIYIIRKGRQNQSSLLELRLVGVGEELVSD